MSHKTRRSRCRPRGEAAVHVRRLRLIVVFALPLDVVDELTDDVDVTTRGQALRCERRLAVDAHSLGHERDDLLDVQIATRADTYGSVVSASTNSDVASTQTLCASSMTLETRQAFASVAPSELAEISATLDVHSRKKL